MPETRKPGEPLRRFLLLVQRRFLGQTWSDDEILANMLGYAEAYLRDEEWMILDTLSGQVIHRNEGVPASGQSSP